MLCYTKFNSFIQFQKVVIVYHVAIEEIDIDIWTAGSIWIYKDSLTSFSIFISLCP